jgi:hypothetical protein
MSLRGGVRRQSNLFVDQIASDSQESHHMQERSLFHPCGGRNDSGGRRLLRPCGARIDMLKRVILIALRRERLVLLHDFNGFI